MTRGIGFIVETPSRGSGFIADPPNKKQWIHLAGGGGFIADSPSSRRWWIHTRFTFKQKAVDL